MLVAGLGTGDHVIGTIFLIRSNEVGIVDARKRNHRGHFFLDLGLESWLENCSTVHCIGQVHAADIPTTNDEVIRVDHGQDIMEWDIDILGRLCIGAELHGRSHDNRAVVISSPRTLTGVPDQAAAVGDDTGSNGRTIVAAPANQHDTSLGDLAIDLEVVDSLLRRSYKLAVRGLIDQSSTVGVLGSNLVRGVGHIRGVDREEVFVGRGRRTISVREARSIFSMRSHVEVDLMEGECGVD